MKRVDGTRGRSWPASLKSMAGGTDRIGAQLLFLGVPPEPRGGLIDRGLTTFGGFQPLSSYPSGLPCALAWPLVIWHD